MEIFNVKELELLFLFKPVYFVSSCKHAFVCSLSSVCTLYKYIGTYCVEKFMNRNV